MILLIARENVMMVLAQPQVRNEIHRAIAEGNGEYSYVDLVARLEEGELQLWLLHEETKLKLVLITGVQLWPRKKTLQIELVAGEDFNSYVHHLDALEAWARQNKVKDIVTLCRPGFQKVAKPLGFKVVGIQLLKEI